MNYFRLLILSIFCLLTFCSCNQKDKNVSGKFFPAISFIKSQVTHVDSSFYNIIKIVIMDGKTDTSFVNREEFRNLAIDFLKLPDISDKKLSKSYKEEKMFDQSLNRVVFTYTALKEGLEIQKLDVVIIPDAGGDKVSNIIISSGMTDKAAVINKNLLWQVDKSFQVVKIIQEENKPEKTIITKVVWNNKED